MRFYGAVGSFYGVFMVFLLGFPSIPCSSLSFFRVFLGASILRLLARPPRRRESPGPVSTSPRRPRSRQPEGTRTGAT